MKWLNGFLCITLFFSSQLLGNDFSYAEHMGGRATEADLVALSTQFKDALENSSFQRDLAQVIKKYAANIDLKQEQYKDLKEILLLLKAYWNIDREKLLQERQRYSDKMLEIWHDKKVRKKNKDTLIANIEKGEEMIKVMSIEEALAEKIDLNTLARVMSEKDFGQNLMEIGSEIAHAIIEIVDEKLEKEKIDEKK